MASLFVLISRGWRSTRKYAATPTSWHAVTNAPLTCHAERQRSIYGQQASVVAHVDASLSLRMTCPRAGRLHLPDVAEYGILAWRVQFRLCRHSQKMAAFLI